METQTSKLAISVIEMASYLGIGRNSAYQLTKLNGFPSIKIGKKIIIPIKALEQWLEFQSKAN